MQIQKEDLRKMKKFLSIAVVIAMVALAVPAFGLYDDNSNKATSTSTATGGNGGNGFGGTGGRSDSSSSASLCQTANGTVKKQLQNVIVRPDAAIAKVTDLQPTKPSYAITKPKNKGRNKILREKREGICAPSHFFRPFFCFILTAYIMK